MSNASDNIENTDNTETKIALINNNISYIQKDVSGINAKLDSMSNLFVTRGQFDMAFKTRDEKIDAIIKTGNLWKWASPLIAAALTGILEFLLISYIQNIRH